MRSVVYSTLIGLFVCVSSPSAFAAIDHWGVPSAAVSVQTIGRGTIGLAFWGWTSGARIPVGVVFLVRRPETPCSHLRGAEDWRRRL